MKGEDVTGRRAEPLVEGKGRVASCYILVDTCPLISSAGLQSDYCCIFDSGTTIFGVGTIDKIDIKVPTSGTEIDTLNAKGKHEGIGSVIGDDVHGAGIVLVVDVLI